MFDNLTSRLSGVIKTLRGEARLTENNIQEALREVRMALLEADVALPVVKEFIARVREKAIGKEVIEQPVARPGLHRGCPAGTDCSYGWGKGRYQPVHRSTRGHSDGGPARCGQNDQ